MNYFPTLKDLSNLIEKSKHSNIKSVLIYKTGSCGFTGDCGINNKNGRTLGVVYKDGREIECIYND